MPTAAWRDGGMGCDVMGRDGEDAIGGIKGSPQSRVRWKIRNARVAPVGCVLCSVGCGRRGA